MADQRGLRRVLLGFRRVVSHESTAKESLDCHGLVGIASLDFCGKYVLQQIATYEEVDPSRLVKSRVCQMYDLKVRTMFEALCSLESKVACYLRYNGCGHGEWDFSALIEKVVE